MNESMLSVMHERARVCPDCPAKRVGILEQLAIQPTGCALQCLTVSARQPLPSGWNGTFGLALVRRGIIIRQRVDPRGRATAIDIAGPGSAFMIADESDEGAMAYAVDDAMLCLCSSNLLAVTVDEGSTVAHGVMRAHTSVITRSARIADARSRATASSRVAALLTTIADTLSSPRPATIPASIQQRDLAALVALRHESVCRVLTVFTRKGLLEKTVQGLRIVDRAALEAA